MRDIENKNPSKTIIIKYEQQPEGIGPFRIWFQELWRYTVTSAGFNSFEIIPATTKECYHTVLLHFHSTQQAQEWMKSGQRSKLLNHKTLYFLSEEDEVIAEMSGYKVLKPTVRLISVRFMVLFISILPISIATPVMTATFFVGSRFESLLQASILALLVAIIVIIVIHLFFQLFSNKR